MFTRNDLPKLFKGQAINMAEIGVEYGGYLDIYYPKLPDANIWLIDLWQTEHNDDYFSKREGQCEKAYDTISNYVSLKNLHLCKGFSSFWAPKFPNQFFDWVYIDADHSYEAVLKDISLWLPKVKMGGIISGHDCNPDPNNEAYETFGVDRAVKEIFGNDVKFTEEEYYKSWYKRV